ncbi:glycosyltransferase [Rhizobium sp. CRIBSB]|nr:glycosyltransferase [Rhizobium sp. CRIBSB]
MTAPVGDKRPRVAVIYHMFPHYRAPVMRALARSLRYEFGFWGSHEPIDGIKAFAGDAEVEVRPLGFRRTGEGGVFSGLWKPVLAPDIDALIILGNPRFTQTWAAAVLGRLTGKKVLFWGHGWLRDYSPLKTLMRHTYFGLANAILVYSDRARALAVQTSFPANKVYPIYNSLDWETTRMHRAVLDRTPASELRTEVGYPQDRPVLICTARLTPLCRFDLLIEAAAIMGKKGRPPHVVLVGDGPMRESLEAQAKAAGVDARFVGAVYDEAVLSRLLYAADVTVSPGKVGLTAMHSLSYGTPVVTHGDLNEQMPEVEAVVEGRTGAFFRRGDSADLARAIEAVLDWPATRSDVWSQCLAVMEDRYTPRAQVGRIEAALDSIGTRRR